jgi:hypothetical protein
MIPPRSAALKYRHPLATYGSTTARMPAIHQLTPLYGCYPV